MNMLDNNISIAAKIYRRRKHIVIASVIAAVIGLVYSFVAKPVYTSTAFVYPANLGLYGQESQTEQLLQFLESNEVRFYLMDKYKLARHYKIDTTKPRYIATFEDVINSQVKITRTKYESVEIKVQDCDPDTAQLIAYGVIEAVNYLIEKEHREKYMEDVLNSKIYLDYKTKEVDSSLALLKQMNEKNGALTVGMQVKETVKNQYKMNSGGNSLNEYISMSEQLKELEKENKSKTLPELLTNINIYSLEYNKVNTFFDDQVRTWTAAFNDYQKKLSEYNRKNSFVAYAARPNRPLNQSWPKPFLVAGICALVMLIFSVLYFVFIDIIKESYAKITAG